LSQVLVTGGAGFLGRHVVRALAAAGHRVRALARQPAPDASAAPVEWVAGDMTDRAVLERSLAGVETVAHLACTTVPQTSEEDRVYDLRSNVESTLLLAECAQRAGVKRFVFASSGGTLYGQPRTLPIPEEHPLQPLCSHGVMKLAIESYLRVVGHLTGLEAVALRMGNAYGPGQVPVKPQGFIGKLAQCVRSREVVEVWGDGNVVRDFVYVEDVARAFLCAVSGAVPSGAYNIGSGEGTSVAQILAVAEEILGATIPVRWRPGRALDVKENVLDIGKATRLLGWSPRTCLRDGLRKTLIDT
jgi:UDP-glucose 4-epimerase